MKKEEEKKAKVKKETKKTVKETSKPKKENKIVKELKVWRIKMRNWMICLLQLRDLRAM